MGSRNGTSIRRRILGRRLRVLREQAGLTLEAAAPALYWSVSKLSRIEIAQQTVDVHAVRSMLDLYGVGGEPWKELTDLAVEAGRRGWWRAYGLGDNSYIGFETEARQVQEFASGFVPGLLQVPGYSEALYRATPIRRTETQLEQAVAARRIRQERLTATEDELRLVAVLAEAVLHNPIGGPAVWREQLGRLIMATELDTVSLQVLPMAVGAHPGLASGFFILNFGDLGEPDMAYVEHALGGLQLEKEEDVARARLTFDRLTARALAPAESLALIERVAEQA